MNGRTRFVKRLVLLTAVAAALLASPVATWAQEKKAAPYVGPASAFKDKKTLAEKLATDIDIHVVETSLREVANLLQDAIGTTVFLRASRLEEAAVSVDTPITISLKGIRLSSALQLLLNDLELTYTERDQYLLITTFEDAESQLQTRVYDVRELLALQDPTRKPAVKDAAVPAAPPGLGPGRFGGGGVGEGGFGEGGVGGGGGLGGGPALPLTDADRLLNLLGSTIQPQSWDEVGGPGSMVEYKGLIVISQTGHVHQQVERLLNMLHEAAGLASKTVKVMR